MPAPRNINDSERPANDAERPANDSEGPVSRAEMRRGLSLVVPFYNEAELLPENLAAIYQFLQRAGIAFELILANDGSSDNGPLIAADFAVAHPGCVLVSTERNTGKGGALKLGIASATLPLIGYIDVDLEIPLAHLGEALDCLATHLEVSLCAGSKLQVDNAAQRASHRNLGSRIYNALARGILGSRVSDHQCGLKVFRREVSDAVLPHVVEDSWAFDTEFLVRAQMAGFFVREIPVRLCPSRSSRVPFWRVAPKMFARLLHLRRLGVRVSCAR